MFGYSTSYVLQVLSHLRFFPWYELYAVRVLRRVRYSLLYTFRRCLVLGLFVVFLHRVFSLLCAGALRLAFVGRGYGYSVRVCFGLHLYLLFCPDGGRSFFSTSSTALRTNIDFESLSTPIFFSTSKDSFSTSSSPSGTWYTLAF